MGSLIKTLVAAGITVGLSDRETFVKEVSTIIDDYRRNPAQSDKLAEAIAAYLENMRDKINTQQAVESVYNEHTSLNKEVLEKLKGAIEQLATEVKNLKERNH